MNAAKSLSPILHLKNTTEKLIEERDHLEIQMKYASQLALAAHLATDAKDRVPPKPKWTGFQSNGQRQAVLSLQRIQNYPILGNVVIS